MSLFTYERALVGVYPLWIHVCGHVEALLPDQMEDIKGGCDGCESDSDQAADWRALYVRVEHAELVPEVGA